MKTSVASSRPLASQGTAPTETVIRPGSHTRRPIMRPTYENLRGIHGYQVDCLSSELREVYVPHTKQHVWLPANLTRDEDFMDRFCMRAISKLTVLAFSKAYQLGYARMSIKQYLPGLETFLRRLQNGERLINDLYVGQCPHPECRCYVNNMDSGHHCLAIGGSFTTHHLGRSFLGLPKVQSKKSHP